MNISFTRKSSNSKTGKIPVTTSSRSSCPASCPLNNGEGCYAEAGYYTRMHWDKVTSGERGGDWGALCNSIAKLPDGTVWRHNIAGDLPHTDQLIDAAAMVQLGFAAKDTKGFTYTHHDMALEHNRAAVQSINETKGFTVNLSADDLTHADKLADLAIGPVAVVVASDQVSNTLTPMGRKVVICPAAIRDDVTCKTCKLCAVTTRKSIIGFPAHGTAKGKIDIKLV